MVFSQFLKRVFIDDQSSCIVDFLQVSIEDGRVDLHASGINHRDEQVVEPDLAAQFVFHAMRHGFQGVDGHHREVGGIANPLGGAHANT